MFAEVTGDCAVGGLGLECLAVRGDEDRSHQTQTAETLSDNVGLNITIVVLQGHNVTTLALDHLSDHVVDQTVLVPDASLLKVGLVELRW